MDMNAASQSVEDDEDNEEVIENEDESPIIRRSQRLNPASGEEDPLEDGSPTEGNTRKRKPVVIPNHITVLDGDPVKYKCDVCTKTFKTKAHIKYHAYCEKGDRPSLPFKCGICDRGFISKSHYQYHLRTHTGERPYVCPRCGKGFNQQGKVTRHMRSHTGERPYGCNECNKRFANAQALQCHVRIHTGERPYVCSHCDKAFNCMSGLKKHSVMHSNERPFICEFENCGKTFALKWTLQIHEKTHSDIRPFACEWEGCKFKFGYRKDLIRHQTVHTRARPFVCGVCNTGFGRKDNMTRHIRSQHTSTKDGEKRSVIKAPSRKKKSSQRKVKGDLGKSEQKSVMPSTSQNEEDKSLETVAVEDLVAPHDSFQTKSEDPQVPQLEVRQSIPRLVLANRDEIEDGIPILSASQQDQLPQNSNTSKAKVGKELLGLEEALREEFKTIALTKTSIRRGVQSHSFVRRIPRKRKQSQDTDAKEERPRIYKRIISKSPSSHLSKVHKAAMTLRKSFKQKQSFRRIHEQDPPVLPSLQSEPQEVLPQVCPISYSTDEANINMMELDESPSVEVEQIASLMDMPGSQIDIKYEIPQTSSASISTRNSEILEDVAGNLEKSKDLSKSMEQLTLMTDNTNTLFVDLNGSIMDMEYAIEIAQSPEYYMHATEEISGVADNFQFLMIDENQPPETEPKVPLMKSLLNHEEVKSIMTRLIEEEQPPETEPKIPLMKSPLNHEAAKSIMTPLIEEEQPSQGQVNVPSIEFSHLSLSPQAVQSNIASAGPSSAVLAGTSMSCLTPPVHQEQREQIGQHAMATDQHKAQGQTQKKRVRFTLEPDKELPVPRSVKSQIVVVETPLGLREVVKPVPKETVQVSRYHHLKPPTLELERMRMELRRQMELDDHNEENDNSVSPPVYKNVWDNRCIIL